MAEYRGTLPAAALRPALLIVLNAKLANFPGMPLMTGDYFSSIVNLCVYTEKTMLGASGVAGIDSVHKMWEKIGRW